MNRRRTRLLKARAREAGARGAALAAVALDRLASPAPGAGALTYHRIADPVRGLAPLPWTVRPATFEAQLCGLLDAGVRFVHASEVLAASPVAGPIVAVTFDGTYATTASAAFPVLRRLGIPATVFLATGHLDADHLPYDEWTDRDDGPPSLVRALSSEEARVLADDPLIEFGAASHTFADFRGRPSAFADDLTENLDALRCLGVDAPPFAFPYGRTAFGYTGGALESVVRRAGVSAAFTTDAAPITSVSDRYALPRFTANEWGRPATILAKLSGRYGWAPRLFDALGARATR